MTLTGFLRILFRWQKWFWTLFVSLAPFVLVAAFFLPLKYEAQMILERKPTHVSSDPVTQEFDMIRLTAETQRNIALLKSRFMMEKWYDALAYPKESDRKKEKRIKRLTKMLSVRPINFTDMVILKIRDKSPDLAKTKALTLAQVFADWDKEEAEIQADKLILLLNDRMEKVRFELAKLRGQNKRYKTVQSLQLSGSIRESAVETEISAKEKLYDQLTKELEDANRRKDKKSLERIHFVTSPSVSSRPIHSRWAYVALALSSNLILSFLFVFVMEWANPIVRRAGDIFSAIASPHLILIPPLDDNATALSQLKIILEPIVHWTNKILNEKGVVVVQWASSEEGDGKTTLARQFAQLMISDRYKTCFLVNTPKSDHGEAAVCDEVVNNGAPMEAQLKALQARYSLILLDSELSQGAMAGSNIVPYADILCMVFMANRTYSSVLKIVQTQIQRLQNTETFFILNNVKEPLPVWLKR